VADLRDHRVVAGEADRRQGRPHAAQRRLALRLIPDPAVGGADRAPQQARVDLDAAARLRLAHLAPHRARREIAGDLAALGAAHAVAHHRQGAARARPLERRLTIPQLAGVEIADRERVLVAVADAADVAGAP